MKRLEDHINKLWASSKLYQAKRSTTRLSCYVIYRVRDENRPPSAVLALEYFVFFLKNKSTMALELKNAT